MVRLINNNNHQYVIPSIQQTPGPLVLFMKRHIVWFHPFTYIQSYAGYKSIKPDSSAECGVLRDPESTSLSDFNVLTVIA